jgi:SAM-dependent methyltransferase
VDEAPVLRATFDEVADAYDRARPGYPAAVFADLAELAELPAGARLLEIGAGTGQATRPLAERGYAVTSIELGEELAAVARRNLCGFPDVRVVTADFETWQPDRAGYDAVVAFGSFHWIAPERRYRRAAELLGPAGRLAVVSMVHVLRDGGDPFFREAEDDYAAVLGEDARGLVTFGRPADPEEIAALSDRVVGEELDASGVFSLLGGRRYEWDFVSTADEYIELLATVSSYRVLDPDVRERLFDRLARRIDARPGTCVRSTYLALLYVAARTPPSAG